MCTALINISLSRTSRYTTQVYEYYCRIAASDPTLPSASAYVMSGSQAALADFEPGYCNTTIAAEGDCWLGDSGSLPLPNSVWRNDSKAAEACISACRDACPRCNYISFLPGHGLRHAPGDCSWYATCDLSRLKRDVAKVRSAMVQRPRTASPPPAPPHPSPLPAERTLPGAAAAFGRAAILSARELERGLLYGDAYRLRRKLRAGLPVTLVAIGASNTVRGGCQEWQMSKCSQAQYTERDRDGSPHGWLMQAFEALNRTWPHPQHKLINRGMMATGPQAYVKCLNLFVPESADAVVLSFADMCAAVHKDGTPETVRQTLNSTFGWSMEAIIRSLLRRPQPPAVALFNVCALQRPRTEPNCLRASHATGCRIDKSCRASSSSRARVRCRCLSGPTFGSARATRWHTRKGATRWPRSSRSTTTSASSRCATPSGTRRTHLLATRCAGSRGRRRAAAIST